MRRAAWLFSAALVLSVAAEAHARPPASRRPPLPRQRHAYNAAIAMALRDVADVWTVPPELVKAIIWTESAFDPRARSHVGARGLMQVMPSTAMRVGVAPDELWVPERNVLAGVRLLATLLKHYEGDVVSALVGYNARPRRRGAPLPQNGETPTYVLRVLERWELLRAEGARQAQRSAA